jgi:hypothetical protein
MIAASSKEYRILATDPRFLWPDGLCFGVDGRLYFFTNAARAMPKGGRTPAASAVELPTNYLFRLTTPSSGRVGD